MEEHKEPEVREEKKQEEQREEEKPEADEVPVVMSDESNVSRVRSEIDTSLPVPTETLAPYI